MLIIQLTESSRLQFSTAVIMTKGSKHCHFICGILTVFILPHPDNKTENKFVLSKIYLQEPSFYNSNEASESN